MNIIPVIDLQDGYVVAAQQGQRESYHRLASPLCSSSNIEAVIHAFLKVYAFKIIYIADLNAITHSGSNQDLINKVIENNQHIEFWIDSGEKPHKSYLNTDDQYKLIIGSESQNNDFKTQLLKDHILSLDFFPKTGYSGPIELLKNTQLWPDFVIIMTLDRVGKNSGPDLIKLREFYQAHPSKNFIAAGGIRDEEDLIKLKKIGINYALIASALHSKKIDSDVIKRLSTL